MRRATGVYQTKRGSWGFRLWHQGREIRRQGYRTASEAAAERVRLRAALLESRYSVPSRMTIEAAAKGYLEWSEGTLRASTHYQDNWALSLFLPLVAGRRLSDIGAGDIEHLRSRLQADGYAPRSRDAVIERVKRLWRRAVELGWLTETQASGVLRHKLERPNNERIRFLSDQEEWLLLDGCPPILSAVIRFAILTGAREGEIVGLKWSDLLPDWSMAVVLAPNSKNNKTRPIYINSAARAVLKELPQAIDPDMPVFSLKGYSPLVNIKRMWRTRKAQVARRAKADKIRWTGADLHFHDLRHTFASRLAMAGEDLLTISKLLGHADYRSALRYAHLTQSHLAHAAERHAGRQAKAQE